MEIRNGRKVANKRNSFIPTKVRGIRAELSWWEMCENVAEIENTTVNEMIVRIVAEHCQAYKISDFKKEIVQKLQEMGLNDNQIEYAINTRTLWSMKEQFASNVNDVALWLREMVLCWEANQTNDIEKVSVQMKKMRELSKTLEEKYNISKEDNKNGK